MPSESLLISLKIGLTLFALYRMECFLRAHRSLEVGAALFLLTLFALVASQDSAHRFWLLAVVCFLSAAVILEPELASLGDRLAQSFNWNSLTGRNGRLTEIARAAAGLANTKTGALIAFERRDGLGELAQSGVEINADIKKELLITLFNKETQTHDGGVLIRGGRITHCSTIFPLTGRTDLTSDLGTRHRAAIGLSEKTDALCLAVSEETGSISLAIGGELIEHVAAKELEKKIRKLLPIKQRKHYYPFHYVRRLAVRQLDPQGVQWGKSLGAQIQDLLAALFWLMVLFLQYPGGIRFQVEELTARPWHYGPLLLSVFHFAAFMMTHTITLNTLGQQISEERMLLGFRLLYRKVSTQDLEAVSLKQEWGAHHVWSLALIRKKNKKPFFLDRSSVPDTLTDWSHKIATLLNLPLLRH